MPVLLLTVALCTPAAAALRAAWEFNPADITGSEVKATGGTAANSTGTLRAEATAATGSLTLDGDGDYLEFGDDVVDLRNMQTMTLAAWVNSASTATTNRRIVEHEDNFYFWTEGNTFRYTTHGAAGRADSLTPPAIGVWQHVLVVYEEGRPARLYVNGLLEGTSPDNQGAQPGNFQTLQIGARRSSSGTATNFWHGQIDDVAVWDTVLPNFAIEALAGTGVGGYAARVTPSATVADCNADGVPDIWYTHYQLDPCQAGIGALNADTDGLTNSEEYARGTNPKKADTDDDGLNDDLEILTDPTRADTDGDGLNDGDEVNTYMTDPLLADTDGDGLSDGAEVLTYQTNPKAKDTDGDGFDDNIEIAAGSDPNSNLSTPGVDLRNGLFVYFSFNNGTFSGDSLLDSGGNAAGPFHGTLTNGGPYSITGKFGAAGSFSGGANNGANPYLDLSAAALALAPLTDGTISAWVNVPAGGLSSDVLTICSVSAAGDASSEARFFVSNGPALGTGTIAYGVRNDGQSLGTVTSGTTAPLLDDQWHHVAVSVSQITGNAIVYIDGVQAGSGRAPFFSGVTGADSVALGRNKDSTAGGGQWFYQGLMDDFALWNRALNPAEIALIYSNGTSGKPLGVVGVQANPVITGVSREAQINRVGVTFDSLPGTAYSLDFSADLNTWNSVEDTVASGISTTLLDDFANVGKSTGFYRIRVLP